MGHLPGQTCVLVTAETAICAGEFGPEDMAIFLRAHPPPGLSPRETTKPRWLSALTSSQSP